MTTPPLPPLLGGKNTPLAPLDKGGKIGIVITVCNRYEYTRQTFIDLNASILPGKVVLVIMDDCSDEDVERLVMNFPFKDDFEVFRIRNDHRKGVAKTLLKGFEKLFEQKCQIMCNLDNDVRLKPDWLLKLMELQVKFHNHIISGFNSNNPKHTVLARHDGYIEKASCGGINLLFHVRIREFVIEALTDNWWDWTLSGIMMSMHKAFIIASPSVVQHAGIESMMKHHKADIADDF
jgi:GT2 family glycosyltransferase